MKSRVFASIVLACLMINSVSAQDIKIEWSDVFQCDNQKYGFFDDLLGSNDEYVYAKFSNLALKPKNYNSSVRLVAYNKDNMKAAWDIVLCGFGTTKDKKNNPYKDLEYRGAVVFKESVFIFWSLMDKEKESIWVESFDAGLKRIGKLQKVYTTPLFDKEVKTSQVMMLSNPKAGEQIVIVNPGYTEDGKNIELDYLVLDNQLEVVKENSVELPFDIEQEYKNLSITSSYQYGDDGMIYALCTVNQGEYKLFKKSKYRSDSFMCFVDIQRGDADVVETQMEKVILTRAFLTTGDGGIRVFGLYRDPKEEGNKGYGADGIFSVTLTKKSTDMSHAVYTPFTKEFLDELFANDYETQKQNEKNAKKSKKKKAKSDDAELAWVYEVENIRMEGANCIMVCSRMNNYSVTTCDGKGNCTTRYYCEKSDVTAIKIDKAGDILWASNLDRKITYPGWNIYDVKVCESRGNYYLAYGNSFVEGAEKKNRKNMKKGDMSRDVFEYATLNTSTGRFDKHDYKVNKPNATKDEIKYVSARTIDVIDNVMYVNSVKTKTKPATYLLCLLPCPGWFMLPFATRQWRTGKGTLGRIVMLD